jgi:protein involved in polysaccharide export with SLBB domain
LWVVDARVALAYASVAACTASAAYAAAQSAPDAPSSQASASDSPAPLTTPGAPTAPTTEATNAPAPTPGFGYDNFRPDAELITDGPVDEFYILSPGDEIIVSIWGDLVQKLNLTVTDEGFIDLPDDGGRIATSGVTLRELRPVIMQALSQIYARYISATDPSKSTAFVDIRLGKVRKLLIYVLGEVNRPGAYLIGAGMSNVLNLLNNAGGVRPTGSLREVEVRRSSGENESVDLYQFFLTGDIDLNAVRLKPNDPSSCPSRSARCPSRGTCAGRLSSSSRAMKACASSSTSRAASPPRPTPSARRSSATSPTWAKW